MYRPGPVPGRVGRCRSVQRWRRNGYIVNTSSGRYKYYVLSVEESAHGSEPVHFRQTERGKIERNASLSGPAAPSGSALNRYYNRSRRTSRSLTGREKHARKINNRPLDKSVFWNSPTQHKRTDRSERKHALLIRRHARHRDVRIRTNADDAIFVRATFNFVHGRKKWRCRYVARKA
ncbi:hypothetical protein EVAR_80172_1 [Eumeta japonica]|uniref:Uncharacterized protein n=1 Tax=Eumeta variegata TaxID=151549 RepID=A0A4C1Y6I0_EUMVA|nr:hypothetical protein EVAR_80172_1 [Eumeta japonica]